MPKRDRRASTWILVAALLSARPVLADPAPGYLGDLSTVRNGAGEPIALGDLRGKVVVLDIWASWCAPCVAALPDLQAIARELQGDGVRVVPVSIDRDGAIAAVRAYAQEGIRSLPLYVGPSEEITRRFGVEGLPFTAVYDRDGVAVARFRGARPWTPAVLRRAILQTLERRGAHRDKN